MSNGAFDVELYDLSTAVIVARKHDERLKEILKRSRDEWETENAELIADVKAADERRKETEAALRRAGLVRYTATNDKKIAPGVVVRVLQKPKYKPAKALEWAMSHRVALKLDVTVFEKMVKSGAVDYGTATVVEEPQVTIATDLESAVLNDVLPRLPADHVVPDGWEPHVTPSVLIGGVTVEYSAPDDVEGAQQPVEPSTAVRSRKRGQ